MDELVRDSNYNLKNNIEKVDKAEVEKKKKHLGQIRMVRGLTLWEVNYVEGTVVKAVLETKQNLAFDVNKHKQDAPKKLVAKKDCIYIQALNLKNAFKKANKRLSELMDY